MNKKEFWKIVDKHKDEDRDTKYDNMEKTLSKYPLEDIGIFDDLYNLNISNVLIRNHNLWDFVNLYFNRPLSDDNYLDFCGWVVGQGSEVYKDVVKDYKNITKHLKSKNFINHLHEEMIYVAYGAYEIVTGQDTQHFVKYFYDIAPAEVVFNDDLLS